MNWGYKILIVYVVFVAGIMFLVFKSSNQKMDLVTTDYYEKELKFQQKIDETTRVNALSVPVECQVNNNQLVITFPKDFAGKKLTGEATLYCPSDQDQDTTKTFAITDTAVTIYIPSLIKKEYELHLTWQANGVDYYMEKKIHIL
jgi:hypothetical protein